MDHKLKFAVWKHASSFYEIRNSYYLILFLSVISLEFGIHFGLAWLSLFSLFFVITFFLVILIAMFILIFNSKRVFRQKIDLYKKILGLVK